MQGLVLPVSERIHFSGALFKYSDGGSTEQGEFSKGTM